MIQPLTGQSIDVQHACRALCVSPSGYYAWKDRPASPRELRRVWPAGEIADVHKASGGTYGALRVTAELRQGRDILVGHNAVSSIMRQLGLKGLPTRRLPTGARVGAGGVDHLLDVVERVARDSRMLRRAAGQPTVGARMRAGSAGQRGANDRARAGRSAPRLREVHGPRQVIVHLRRIAADLARGRLDCLGGRGRGGQRGAASCPGGLRRSAGKARSSRAGADVYPAPTGRWRPRDVLPSCNVPACWPDRA